MEKKVILMRENGLKVDGAKRQASHSKPWVLSMSSMDMAGRQVL